MNAREAVFAVALVAALLVVVTGVTQAQMFASSSLLDQKNLGDVLMEIQVSTIEVQNKKKYKAMKEIAGRAFWSECFKQKVLDADMMGKLASLGSVCGDTPSDGKWLDEEDGKLEQRHCSYTSPKADQLLVVLNLRGSKNSVLFTFDSRNWTNYGKKGVLSVWSEGENGEFMTAAAAEQQFKITAEDWKDPAAKVLGVMRPFDKTFQEAGCAAYVNPEAPKKDDTDYNAVFRKKNRSWTFKGSEKRDGKEIVHQLRCTVKEVIGNEATLLVEELDGEGKVLESKERVEDLSDVSVGRPSRCMVTEDAETEIETAGKKWKARKWVQFDGKRTYWMSTEIPGLVIKGEMSNGQTFMLIEFEEGE